jgi:DNA modification methylase
MFNIKEIKNKILLGDNLEILKNIPSNSIDMCITSPPYWGLRNYHVDGQIGNEKTFNEYLDKLINIFSEVKRVLKDTGSCWVNLGDTYNNSGSSGKIGGFQKTRRLKDINGVCVKKTINNDLVEKSLCHFLLR